eukprot:3924691-Pleurochrysis_carterae.AAC.1
MDEERSTRSAPAITAWPRRSCSCALSCSITSLVAEMFHPNESESWHDASMAPPMTRNTSIVSGGHGTWSYSSVVETHVLAVVERPWLLAESCGESPQSEKTVPAAPGVQPPTERPPRASSWMPPTSPI